jgi:hypothetical protein
MGNAAGQGGVLAEAPPPEPARTGPGRRARLAIAFGAAVLVAAVAVGAVAMIAGPGRVLALVPARDVPVPAADAEPQHVVRSYLDALDAHDLDTARTLLTSDYRQQVDRTGGNWFGNLRSARDVRVRAAEDARDGYGVGSHYPYAVRVPVTFELRLFFDQPVGDGPLNWSFVLVRKSVNEPWRIRDEGPV